jgi:hypothetical protein
VSEHLCFALPGECDHDKLILDVEDQAAAQAVHDMKALLRAELPPGLSGEYIDHALNLVRSSIALETLASLPVKPPRCGCTICDDRGEPCPHEPLICYVCQDNCWGWVRPGRGSLTVQQLAQAFIDAWGWDAQWATYEAASICAVLANRL